MKTVGLTGGIGSGKSTVANFFKEKNISVYISDDRAKWLMNHSIQLKQEITSLLGEESYFKSGELNKQFVASKIFQDTFLLNKINQTVHPFVFNDFEEWKKKQISQFVIKESAILFESKGNIFCDLIITVTATEAIRINRVMERENISKQQVMQRIKQQFTDEQKIANSDFVIENNLTKTELNLQTELVYLKIIKLIKS